jgi:hypothetical protein
MRGVGLVMFLFFFVLPVAFFVWILRKGLKGAKADEWEGEVIDKLYNTKRDDGKVSEFYSIVFKTNKGERKMAVNSADYPNWKVGDKARKIKGKFGVERV